MEWFEGDQRIKVVNAHHPLCGVTGKVWRLRFSDNHAWVDMDCKLPDDLASFTEGDERRNTIVLSPQDCEPAVEPAECPYCGEPNPIPEGRDRCRPCLDWLALPEGPKTS